MLDEKSARSKQSRQHSHQAGREQWRAHHGHVGVPRRNLSGFQLARTASGSNVTNKLVRRRMKCSSESEESYAEQDLNGLEQGEDAMTDNEEGGGEAGTADWRVRPGPAREREEHEALHMPIRDWCTHCMTGRGRTHHHEPKKRSEDLSRRPITAMDSYFPKPNSTANFQTVPDEPVTCITMKEHRHQNIMSSVVLVKGIQEPWAVRE